MTRYKLNFFVCLLVINFSISRAQISDKRLCVDPECNKPISRAKTLILYNSPDNNQLSFKSNENVVIYSKSAGSNINLWGAEINGKRGYIPKNLVRETQMLGKPKLLVDTEIIHDPQVPSKEIVNPTKVKESYEIVDGTTLYMHEDHVESNKQPAAISNFDSIVENKETPNVTQIPLDDLESQIPVNKENDSDNKEASYTDIIKENSGAINADEEKVRQDIEESNKSADLDSNTAGFLKGLFDNVMGIMAEGDDIKINNNIESNSELKASQDHTKNSNEKDDTSNRIKGSVSQEKVNNKMGNKGGEVHETAEITGSNLEIENDKRGKETDRAQETAPPVEIEDANGSVESTGGENISNIVFENKQSVKDNEILKKVESHNEILQENIEILEDENNTVNNLTDDEGNETKLSSSGDQLELTHNNSNEQVLSEISVENEKFTADDLKKMEENISNIPDLNNVNSHNEGKSEESLMKNDNEVLNDLHLPSYNKSDVVLETATEPIFSFDLNKSEQKIDPIVTEPSGEKDHNEIKSNEDLVESYNETLNKDISEEQERVVLSYNNTEIASEHVTEPPLKENVQTNQEQVLLPYSQAITQNPLNADTEESKNYKQNMGENDKKVPEGSKSVEAEPAMLVQNNVENFDQTSAEFIPTSTPIPPNVNIYQSDKAIDDSVHKNSEFIPPPPPIENQANVYHSSVEENNIDSTTKDNVQKYYAETHTDNQSKNTEKKMDNEILDNISDNNEQNIKDDDESEKQSEQSNENVKISAEPENIFKYLGSNVAAEIKESVLESENSITDQKNQQNSDILENTVTELKNEDDKMNDEFCMKEECSGPTKSSILKEFLIRMELPNFDSDVFLYLATTAISVIIFLLGHFALDKSRREGPLVAKINHLEKEFLILIKEKELLLQQVENKTQQNEYVESEDYLNLQQEKQALEDQVQTLEKELENSTEVGLELNRMLSEVLNSENAGETLMLNIESLQAQLAEQQGIVSNMKEMLSFKETENHELHLELDIANKRVIELQSELDKLLRNIIKIEEEKDLLEKDSESQIIKLKDNFESLNAKLKKHQEDYTIEIERLSSELSTSNRNLQLKTKEYDGLKESMKELKNTKNGNKFESLLEVNAIKAELEQFKTDYQYQYDNLKKEKEKNSVLEKRARIAEDEIQSMKGRFDEVDKVKLELETKLQVLTNYFKEKEEQLQKELAKYESMWSAKQGEATSTSERIKYLQSEVQNYKTQNETLKHEIVSQEVELKSQISVLEKKVHENWVSARQAERRLEDMKQEAAQLRNRLTLRERALQEDNARKRMQSPLDQSTDLPVSPLHLESPSSPTLMYSSREHITKSPPILGMPPPFLPPPPGAPFLPPPHLSFMPPPPDMFPGDHRPPPLGRMSSPPLNSRYSPDRRAYSPYERRSPSPSYDESEYGTSPVHHRRYSPFSGRRDHRRIAPPMGKINGKGGALSSGSDNSNESLDEINHSNLKV